MDGQDYGSLLGGGAMLIGAVAWAIREFGKLYADTIKRLAKRLETVEAALKDCHAEREAARTEASEARAAAEQALGVAMRLREWAESVGMLPPNEPIVPTRVRLPIKTPAARPAMTEAAIAVSFGEQEEP